MEENSKGIEDLKDITGSSSNLDSKEIEDCTCWFF